MFFDAKKTVFEPYNQHFGSACWMLAYIATTEVKIKGIALLRQRALPCVYPEGRERTFGGIDVIKAVCRRYVKAASEYTTNN